MISYTFVLDNLVGLPKVRKKDYFLLASWMPLKKRARAGYGAENQWYGSMSKILGSRTLLLEGSLAKFSLRSHRIVNMEAKTWILNLADFGLR